MSNALLRFSARAAAALSPAALLAPLAANAQLSKSQDDLTAVGGALGGTSDLPTLVANGINAVLGVLGIVFVVLIVYAGFLYLTDQGSGDGVKKAKSLLQTSIIGIVIIIAAYAIANFVIGTLITVSGT